MKSDLRVLVTGAGAPGTRGTVFAIRRGALIEGIRCYILGTDSDLSRVSGLAFDDISFLPPAGEPGYVEAVNAIVEKYSIDVILPQTTSENAVLAMNQTKVHCPVVTSSSETIARSNNKFLVTQAFAQSGYPVPQFTLTRSRDDLITALNNFGFPERAVVVKLLSASGGRGVRIVSNEVRSWESFSSEKPSGMLTRLPELLEGLEDSESWPELLVTERIFGPEITVDVYRGKSGQVAIPRLRSQIRTGISTITDVFHDESLSSMVLDVSNELGLVGAFGFQFMLKGDQPLVIECNPRVQGTMVASLATGNNVIWMAVRDKLEFDKPLKVNHYWGNSRLVRHWGGTVHLDNEVLEF